MSAPTVERPELDRRAASFSISDSERVACVPVQDFAASMRKLASGVVIITVFVDGEPWGLTLSSLSSFSADPARISLSILKTNVTAGYIQNHGTFGVAILPHTKAGLAANMAAPQRPKFIPADELMPEVGPKLGLPAIEGALFNLECQVAFHVEAIDHILIVADVVSARAGSANDVIAPLTYFDRIFGTVTESPTHEGTP